MPRLSFWACAAETRVRAYVSRTREFLTALRPLTLDTDRKQVY